MFGLLPLSILLGTISLSESAYLLPSLLLANGTTNGTIIPGYNGTQSELNGTSIFIRKVSACVACESTLEGSADNCKGAVANLFCGQYGYDVTRVAGALFPKPSDDSEPLCRSKVAAMNVSDPADEMTRFLADWLGDTCAALPWNSATGDALLRSTLKDRFCGLCSTSLSAPSCHVAVSNYLCSSVGADMRDELYSRGVVIPDHTNSSCVLDTLLMDSNTIWALAGDVCTRGIEVQYSSVVKAERACHACPFLSFPSIDPSSLDPITLAACSDRLEALLCINGSAPHMFGIQLPDYFQPWLGAAQCATAIQYLIQNEPAGATLAAISKAISGTCSLVSSMDPSAISLLTCSACQPGHELSGQCMGAAADAMCAPETSNIRTDSLPYYSDMFTSYATDTYSCYLPTMSDANNAGELAAAAAITSSTLDGVFYCGASDLVGVCPYWPPAAPGRAPMVTTLAVSLASTMICSSVFLLENLPGGADFLASAAGQSLDIGTCTDWVYSKAAPADGTLRAPLTALMGCSCSLGRAPTCADIGTSAACYAAMSYTCATAGNTTMIPLEVPQSLEVGWSMGRATLESGSTLPLPLRLSGPPPNATTLTIAVFSADPAIASAPSDPLVFSALNYDVWQTLNVTALALDAATTSLWAQVTISDGVRSNSTNVTIAIVDVVPFDLGLSLFVLQVGQQWDLLGNIPAYASLLNGTSRLLPIRLSAAPKAGVAVSVNITSADTAVSTVQDGDSIVFDSLNYAVWQYAWVIATAATNASTTIDARVVFTHQDARAETSYLVANLAVYYPPAPPPLAPLAMTFGLAAGQGWSAAAPTAVPHDTSASLPVRLTSAPLADTVATVTLYTRDASVAVIEGLPLVFTAANFETMQSVQVRAVAPLAATTPIDASVVLTRGADKITQVFESIAAVSVLWGDVSLTIDFSLAVSQAWQASELHLPNGSVAALPVRLSAAPPAGASVQVLVCSDATSVVEVLGGSLEFNYQNWNQWQSATVHAKVAGSARLSGQIALVQGDRVNGTSVPITTLTVYTQTTSGTSTPSADSLKNDARITALLRFGSLSMSLLSDPMVRQAVVDNVNRPIINKFKLHYEDVNVDKMEDGSLVLTQTTVLPASLFGSAAAAAAAAANLFGVLSDPSQIGSLFSADNGFQFDIEGLSMSPPTVTILSYTPPSSVSGGGDGGGGGSGSGASAGMIAGIVVGVVVAAAIVAAVLIVKKRRITKNDTAIYAVAGTPLGDVESGKMSDGAAKPGDAQNAAGPFIGIEMDRKSTPFPGARMPDLHLGSPPYEPGPGFAQSPIQHLNDPNYASSSAASGPSTGVHTSPNLVHTPVPML